MFSDYSRPYYNVNNKLCTYPEIETLYAFSLVFQEVILNVEDLERSICSLGHLKQYHRHRLLAYHESLYLGKTPSISTISLTT